MRKIMMRIIKVSFWWTISRIGPGLVRFVNLSANKTPTTVTKEELSEVTERLPEMIFSYVF